MNVFIIGASGLVGSNCLHHFTEQGWNVKGSYFSFPTTNCVFFNTLDLAHPDNFDLLSWKPNIIVHCGALTHVDYCEQHPEESYEKTVQSTLNIISLAKQKIYFDLIKSSVIYTNVESNIQYHLENDKVSIEYLRIPYEIIPDSTLKIKDSEILSYLKNNTDCIAVCGQTVVKNKYESFITIIQCFEYFISHLLLKTFEHNSNVHIFDLAITDQNKSINFYELTENTGNSLVEIPKENRIGDIFKGITQVQGINLEEYVIKNMLPLPTLLKVDIEGSEYDFFENTSDAFFSNTNQIIVEFHHNIEGTSKLDKIQYIIKRFLNLGYKIQVKEGDSIDNDMFTILLTKFG